MCLKIIKFQSLISLEWLELQKKLFEHFLKSIQFSTKHTQFLDFFIKKYLNSKCVKSP